MLNERVRNTIVGLTMLIGLALLLTGIFIIDRFPRFAQPKPYKLTLTAVSADGLSPGNKVNFNGVYIGSLARLSLAPDMQSVILECNIDNWVNLPSNTVAYVGKQTIGAAFVTLTLPPDPLHPETRAPASPVALPKDGSAKVAASPADVGLIPKAVIDRLTRVADDLDDLLAEKFLVDFEKNPDKRVANISILVQRIDRLARGFDILIGDPTTQNKFHEIVDNINRASKQLNTIMDNANNVVAKASNTVDSFGNAAGGIQSAATQASATLVTTRQEILKVSEKLATTLASIEKTMNSLTNGNGTAGRLLNDPRLYDGLVDLSKSLKSTTDDLNLLVRKWKEEGLRLNLK